ncbi:cyclic nucleotide-binding domain-containing protein [Belliella kenyensis]|uniref:Cyclic nucleotide-binding domain-containing protein n=1 Tax=Belliella kenyensis TaxID=1472724 RepID=A0ABV8ELU3_9BACT|nr:cyclic nucleotide-binding domain-containing protein [Belliella kenyensis]MCH7400872.1 cyclic nucleotide-binding domain-containing protein [Belliella kenyensis]MDN3601841.1 cyclic nucleotide-binding domain-containing protein [Belliella kenyensis]
MRKFKWTKTLKKDFDHLISLNEEDYESLLPYINIRIYKKGEIIRSMGEYELNARYVNKGWVAEQWPATSGRDYRVRIFGPGKIASDMDAFFHQKKSQSYIKAITYVSTFELSREKENTLLQEHPMFFELASKINRLMYEDSVSWSKLKELPIDEGLRKLKSNYSEELSYLSNKDLAYIFKTSIANIVKVKGEAF